MNIKPLGDNVLVKQLKAEQTTSFGLVLSGNAGDKPEGEVIAVGPGKRMENGEFTQMQVQVGDHVVLKNWGGEKFTLEKEEYKIISQDDILAIIEK